MNTPLPTIRWGLIGLGAMGRNLALNFADHGIPLDCYDADPQQASRLKTQQPHAGVTVHTSLENLLLALPSPRAVLILVPAGPAVDALLAELVPRMRAEDVILDASNAHYPDTLRRCSQLGAGAPALLDIGMSGGPDGARHGPAILLGGEESAARRIAPTLARIAWQDDTGSGFARLGRTGAGHFVKMVHNGIEYVEMQLIAEAWLIMRLLLGLSAAEGAAIFQRWNDGRLAGYLVEITASILRKQDPETGEPLIEHVRDRARQKGTGRWTAQAALELEVFAPLFDVAVSMRHHSLAHRAAPPLAGITPAPSSQREAILEQLEAALFAARIMAFFQGFALLDAGDARHGWQLDPAAVLTTWRRGSVIRCALLGTFHTQVAQHEATFASLPEDASILALLKGCATHWRLLVTTTVDAGLPIPAMSLALSCWDALGKGRLGGELIQAQRDCFGHHGFERTDREGTFHTHWLE
ncbi:MAG: NADP-dependent phosphogluconate dehydrogenase [Magnetococcus sp. MYC-9]